MSALRPGPRHYEVEIEVAGSVTLRDRLNTAVREREDFPPKDLAFMLDASYTVPPDPLRDRATWKCHVDAMTAWEAGEQALTYLGQRVPLLKDIVADAHNVEIRARIA